MAVASAILGAGMFASGWLIDRLSRRSKTFYAWLPAAGLTIAASRARAETSARPSARPLRLHGFPGVRTL